MDEWAILQAQVLALRQKFDYITRLLESPRLDSGLRSRVKARFDTLLNRQRILLKEVETKASSKKELPSCWDDFRKVKNDSGPIFRECLAFMEGALVRGAGIDNGVCRIADGILDNLSRRSDIRWDRFTILATDEFFGNMAEIIRLRFPEANVWHLPVAVHEFGHFVAQELKTPGTFTYPFQEILKSERDKGPQYANHLQEFFADIFAIYAAGPALAYTCVSLRFDPGTSRIPSRTHPPDAQRFYVQLNTLRMMDQTSGSPRPLYHETAVQLEGIWLKSLEANMQIAKLDEAEAAGLDAMLGEIFKMLMRELPPGVRYDGWLRAQMLASAFNPEDDELPQPSEETTPLDVINAAWLWRANSDQGDMLAINRISSKAVKLCERLMGLNQG